MCVRGRPASRAAQEAPWARLLHRFTWHVPYAPAWRVQSRATAIDSLHKALKNVGSKALLLPYLPELVTFLVGLVADPNFKISISAMAIVGDLAAKAGKDLEPQLRCGDVRHDEGPGPAASCGVAPSSS